VNPAPVIEARGISVSYGAIQALRDAEISLYPGEVVALVGDNGAGKSTLAGVLSGETTPTSGELLVEGAPHRFHSPLDARRRGIEMVFQDLALAPDLTVSENLFLGREEIARRGRLIGWVDRGEMNRRCREELDRLSVRIPSVKVPCRALSGGQRQAIAIARAVVWSSKVLLLDEPTAALGVEQQAQVGALIKQVAERGVAVMLISHNLPQVVELADRVVVLWTGRTVANLKRGEFEAQDLIEWITGAALVRKEKA
jgi:simple sugar transport system ATP-binding protein